MKARTPDFVEQPSAEDYARAARQAIAAEDWRLAFEQTYSWEQPKGKINKVTYKGTKDGNCKVSGKGGVGKELVKGYDHSLGPAADPKSPTKQGFFGVGFSQQSDDTYDALKP